MKPTDAQTSRLSTLVGHYASEMIDRWRNGERPDAEEFLDRSPDLWQRPEPALELIAEELSLRGEYSLPIDEEDLVDRFPQWSVQVRALYECQRALGSLSGAARFPAVGDELDDFSLVAELGRGSHGRVFLATQFTLGDRPVVLKLTPDFGVEHLSLARLQHTHIVPLYSAHEFPERGLRGLCLPYFGGETLEAKIAARRNGRGASAQGLSVEIICQIGVCLAEALQYAHDRGLLHLDLKPSNVLIAADGTPMLLDFHLARAPLRAGEPAPVWLGGTPGYMAPELAGAVSSVRQGGAVPLDVDARADLFSLGVLLRELLAGSDYSVGLSDILSRTTAERAGDRYGSASALAIDLKRHLSHQPLVGVANRSFTERWRKWRRRRPYSFPAGLLLASIALSVGIVLEQTNRHVGRARDSLREAEAHLQQGRFAEAIESLKGGEALIEDVPFESVLAEKIRETKTKAERLQALADLHAFCDQLRSIDLAEAVPADPLRLVESRCRTIWTQRNEILRELDVPSLPVNDRSWRNDFLDLAIIGAHLKVRIAAPENRILAQETALDMLVLAEGLLGPSAALHRERSLLEQSLGRFDTSKSKSMEREPTAAMDSSNPWERLIAGRSLCVNGDYSAAMTELDRCLECDPTSFWAHYYRGVCLFKLEKHGEAAMAFSVCLALSPRSAWCFYNRGLAHSRAGLADLATRDFERALSIDPKLPVPRP